MHRLHHVSTLTDTRMHYPTLVRSGDILDQNHCYRADEMAVMLDVGHEFGYKTRAFHHAVEAYKIADLLAKEDVCVATWATRWGFKMEAYDANEENRSEERRVGKEGVRKCRSRWSPYH